MTRNIVSDPKFVFEVRGGVLLMRGERTKLADGWWFSTNSDTFGPFATDQEALDAAAVAFEERRWIRANPDKAVEIFGDELVRAVLEEDGD